MSRRGGARATVRAACLFTLLLAVACKTAAPPAGATRPLAERRADAKRAAAEKWEHFQATATAPEHARAVLGSLALSVVSRDINPPRLEVLMRATVDGVQKAAGLPALSPTAPMSEVHDAYVAGLQRLWLRPWSMNYEGLVRTGATAMLESLNDGSGYEPPPKISPEAMLAYAEGTFGMLLGAAGAFPVVVLVATDSPAARAGVRPGDQLVMVAETSTENRPVDEVRSMIRKTRAGELEITLFSVDTQRTLILSREALSSGDFGCRVLARRVLYLRPRRFSPTTLAQMRAASAAGGDLADRVELDLRAAVSAGLEDTIDLANLLLGPDPFVSLVASTKRQSIRAVPDGSRLNRSRLAILVDGKNAGTTEIVAAAVQDQRRGFVVGSPTHGDTRIQDFYFLDGAGYARLTTARALRVGGGEITGVGVTPDVRASSTDAVRGGSEVDDQPCPGARAGERVVDDPVVLAGLRELLAH